MNICLVGFSNYLASAFQSLGHTVLALDPQELFTDLPALLRRHSFTPDAVIQVERLGRRVLLSDLPSIPCPKLFWSVDTHMNLHWQAHYARLFDTVLTTQRAWAGRFASAGSGPGEGGDGGSAGGGILVEWLPWHGTKRDFRPHSQRGRELGFVGRVTKHRPARRWFAEHLRAAYGFVHEDNLSWGPMHEYYDDCRLVPNEALFGEVNFRLFEAASCGCAVLTPDVPAEVGELFVPGREVETYGNVLELGALIERLRKRPEEARRLGLAAWERIRREHLPRHRAARLAELAGEGAGRAAGGRKALRCLARTTFALWESGGLTMGKADVFTMLERAGGWDALPGEHLRALAMTGDEAGLRERVHGLVRDVRDGGGAHAPIPVPAAQVPARLELACLASAAALRLGEWDVAKFFWYRHMEASRPGQAAPKPGSPPALMRLWAGEQRRAGRELRAGFVFREREHLPLTAMECLFMALDLGGAGGSRDVETLSRLESILEPVRGAEPGRLAFLSQLALLRPKDWRTALELALTNLRAFRLREGVGELLHASGLAARAGQEDRFMRVLAGKDRRGLLRAALATSGGQEGGGPEG
jgi:hypothetical protein